MESLGRRISTRSPRRHRRLLHLWFTSVATRYIAHISGGSSWRLGIVELFGQTGLHLNVWWVWWIRVNGVVNSTWLGLHCGLIQLRVLQVLLMKLCFCGGGCGGRILAVQDGREVHDPTRRSAADRGRRKLEKLPADRSAARA